MPISGTKPAFYTYTEIVGKIAESAPLLKTEHSWSEPESANTVLASSDQFTF